VSLSIGSRLGSYEILSLLGKGGMGEVYRARDIKLKREVAIKILPDEFSRDADRVSRFQREAEVLASLNHPNIGAIHSLEGSAGSILLVLELVEGETLAERIQRSPVPVEEALHIAKGICEALEAAHEKGVVHRDLKPANVKLTPDGSVKVLDFGLATAIEIESLDTALSNSPTVINSIAATNRSVIIGTAAYMSPEQARGRHSDKRADIWAFGCVLYEMLAGKPAFEGADLSEVLAGVIKSDPAWDRLPAGIPPMVRMFLHRCLEKDPKRRVHDIGDVRLAFDGAFDGTANPPPGTTMTAPKRSRRLVVTVSAASYVVVALVAAIAVSVTLRPVPQPIVRLTATPPAQLRLAHTTPESVDLAFSPDGRRLAFLLADSTSAVQRLYVRSLDQLETIALAPQLIGMRNLFISPDGNWVDFFLMGTLMKVAINGGPAVTICKYERNSRGASWGPENDIIFATAEPTTGLLRVAAGGGEPKVLTTPEAEKGEGDHLFPEVLPGGRAVLFTIASRGNDDLGESSQIAVLDLVTGERKVLLRGGTNAHYASSGHIVYGLGGTIRAVAFDLDRLEVRGDPAPVVEDLVMKTGGFADFSIAQNGSLAYVTGDAEQTGPLRTLVWVDRQGREEPIEVPLRAYTFLRISPDGTRVALDLRDQSRDTWIWHLTRRTLTRLTFDPGGNIGVAWTPDGQRLAFSARREGLDNIYWQAANGTGAVDRLTQGPNGQFPSAFSPDGKRLLFMTPFNGPYDIGIVSLEGERRAEVLIRTSFSELNPEISPDGRWLAYESNESGRPASTRGIRAAISRHQ
jgi:Tol biopolymer transport system component